MNSKTKPQLCWHDLSYCVIASWQPHPTTVKIQNSKVKQKPSKNWKRVVQNLYTRFMIRHPICVFCPFAKALGKERTLSHTLFISYTISSCYFFLWPRMNLPELLHCWFPVPDNCPPWSRTQPRCIGRNSPSVAAGQSPRWRRSTGKHSHPGTPPGDCYMTSQAGSGLKMDSVFNPFIKAYMFLQRMLKSSYR